MPIKVTCQCGQAFAAKNELAGKAVKCPKCGSVLKIPRPKTAAKSGGISDLLDEVGMRANVARCPGCGAELPGAAVLCVMCGFDLRLGHRIKTIIATGDEIDDEGLGDLPTHDNPRLDHAEREIARTKIEIERLDTGLPWWMIFLALAGVVGFAAGMLAMPKDKVMGTSGYVLVGAGGALGFYCVVRILIMAFQESAAQGLLSLFFPLYILYFSFSRWDRCAGIFILLVGGLLMQAFGGGLIAIGSWLTAGKEDAKFGWLRMQSPPAVVRDVREFG